MSNDRMMAIQARAMEILKRQRGQALDALCALEAEALMLQAELANANARISILENNLKARRKRKTR